MERRFVIVGPDRHLGAGKHRPIVHRRRDAVHRAAGDGQAAPQCLSDDVGTAQRRDDQAAAGDDVVAAVCGQQRRMLVDHLGRAAIEERSREHAHEAGEHHQVGLEHAQYTEQPALPGRPHGGTRLRRGAGQRHKGTGDRVAKRTLEPIGIGAVAQHQHDLSAERAGVARVDQRLQVRATAGDQHGHLEGVHECRL